MIPGSWHWVLDMRLREDESCARVDNSAENLNVFRYWAYNVLTTEASILIRLSWIKLHILSSAHISFTHFNAVLKERDYPVSGHRPRVLAFFSSDVVKW